MNLIMLISMRFFDIQYMLINREHINWLKTKFSTKSIRQNWVQDEHHHTLITWFTDKCKL